MENGIIIKVHTHRDHLGRLETVNVDGIPQEWTDAMFEDAIRHDVETDGPWASLAWMLTETPMIDISYRHGGSRCYLDR